LRSVEFHSLRRPSVPFLVLDSGGQKKTRVARAKKVVTVLGHQVVECTM